MTPIKDKILTHDNAASLEWDTIIIGAGMGGAAAAYALSQAGEKVLLIERGRVVKNETVSEGVTSEVTGVESRLRTGQWPEKIRAEVDGFTSDIWPAMGCGLGGSTLLYAAALQRLDPMDFSTQTLPTGETIRWPFSYEDLSHFYEKAESLLGVRGTVDPLSDEKSCSLKAPPAMCEADQNYFSAFKSCGLNPFRLHVGIDYKEGCGECGGHVCPILCKRDAFNSFILPAIETGSLFILPENEVNKIVEEHGKVTSVGLLNGVQLKSKNYFLAAGALNSAKLLLESEHTDGHAIGNHSNHLGRNLMFHASDFLAVWPTKKSSRTGPNKTIALRDFYKDGNMKLGEFQSTGLRAGYGNILYAAKLALSQSRFRRIPLLSQFLRIPAYLISKALGEASIFATIVEDYPYNENRVVIDKSAPSGMRIVYTVHDEFSERVQKMSASIRNRLKKLRTMKINFDLTLNYGHPCGTCKSAEDKKDGVLDANCKVFGVSNLYVVDASFMPTSGGTNPSLTIAANALRVAESIVKNR